MGKPWADQPFALIATPTDTEDISVGTVNVATEMALAHNVMLRNLNAIYLQATGVKQAADIADFLILCQSWWEALHHHHSMEEELFFPVIEEYTGEKGIMEINVSQHAAFEAGLEQFRRYVFDITPETYDGKKLKEVIDGFGLVLSKHLKEEISSLLALEKFGGDKLLKTYKDMEGKAINAITDKHRMLPSGLAANDVTFEGGKHKWPPFPFFVPYLVHYYYGRKYRSVWRLSPCTIFGIPQELPFASEE